ncbi:fibronectin type III domain-containing protein 3B-like [Oncorhynchus tshawytscha]|uniref:fibronectin type III domain-containing protein 3B-like n=1 Tax=Oncorhynchus tshawytscha TaxID=74940 RepID=UPI001C3CD849|nr:fibronectin type III domain-containing protein 3B-like [Oncorhynchus tshawytscha]
MYVTMMMTDQLMDLAPPPLLNGELPLMQHMVNGDAAQQVILVQVNPGETFTIRAEDGSLQCIQGRSHAYDITTLSFSYTCLILMTSSLFSVDITTLCLARCVCVCSL